MVGDKKEWSKKIQEDKAFAKSYKGLTSVKAILKKAKEDGYNVTEAEITKEDLKALESVAGGSNGSTTSSSAAGGQVNVSAPIEVNTTSKKATVNVSAGENSRVENNNAINIS